MSSHSHERNSTDGRVREAKPHHMGLQISCGFHPEMSAQDVVSGATSSSGRVFRRLALRKESKVEEGHLMPDHVHMLLSIRRNMRCRRSSGTSRARARSTWLGFMESANAISSDSTLGPGVLRQHGRAGQGGDPRLHSQPRERGSEAEQMNLELKTPPSGGPKLGAASATPPTASSGSNHKAPRFAGGYSPSPPP